jgi:hypothetical protein
MDSIEIGGKWWLKDMDVEDEFVPDQAVAGTLTYSPEYGVELDLLGSFYGMFERYEDGSLTEEGPVTIFGVTTEGEYMTILDSMYAGESTGTKDISFTTASYEKGTIIRGGLVDTDTTYWKCSFSFSNLGTWTGIRTVTTPGNHDIDVGPAVSESLSTDTADIMLNIHEDMSSAIDGRRGRVYFTVYPAEPLTYSEYLSEYVRPLQNLITLGVDQAVFPTFLNLFCSRFGHPDSKHSAYWNVPYYREQDDVKHFNINFMVQDIKFPDVVEQWLDSSSSVERLHDHYFGTRYNDRMYVNTQFMSMMFALEAYHRRAFPDRQKTMRKSVYRRVRETTLERMPKVAVWGRTKDLFESIVNEPSIGDRLLDITDRHEGMFPDSYDIKSNLSTIKDVRHTIAHSLPEELSTTDIARAEIRVRIIVLAVLLETVGIDEEKGREILEDEYSGIDRIIEGS